FVMLDDVHLITSPGRAGETAGLAVEALEKSVSRFVVASRRRFRPDTHELDTFELEALAIEEIAKIFERAAETETTASVSDLAALRAGGDLSAIYAMAASASKGERLETFRAFEMLYTEAVFGGRLASAYDRRLRSICGTAEAEAVVTRLLYELILLSPDSAEVAAWGQKLDIAGAELIEIITRLNEEEIIRLAANRVEAMPENRILSDYIRIRSRLEGGRESRAAIFADTLAANIKQGPAEMAEHYRKGSLIGLRELMSSFNANEVPAALIDYARFKAKYKGLSDNEIQERLSSDDEKIALPQIIFSANTETFYRAIGLVTEPERSAVAVGFEQGDLGGENQTAWIGAEIDSKLEVPAEIAQSWCDRLEMAAAVSGFSNFKIWLVATEGFNDDAMRLLAQRGAYGSSRRQTELLTLQLASAASGTVESEAAGKVEEYEIVIPMGGDAEMVAAHTVEDIARRHDMSPKAINQIKTALVEACINATEHSHSPDRRIHQRFVVRPGSITITVSNRGVRLTDQVQPVEPDEGRRGWGLKLMRNLMDDVRIEQVDDGTRISMTKLF
ncbi:MAG TPA: ATP-binding protein, partial [Pyrinomonadaceae bacterium]|nr:ATP-binding protein [Pyrinomonadaceae bacterium]